MKHTLIFATLLIALLAASTIILLSHEKQNLEAGQQRATYDQWKQCKNTNNWNPFCNQYKDPQLNQPCQGAQSQVSYCENGNKDCKMLFMYLEEPQEEEPLPDCFYKCASACNQYSKGDEFYKKNYDIYYNKCAFTN